MESRSRQFKPRHHDSEFVIPGQCQVCVKTLIIISRNRQITRRVGTLQARGTPISFSRCGVVGKHPVLPPLNNFTRQACPCRRQIVIGTFHAVEFGRLGISTNHRTVLCGGTLSNQTAAEFYDLRSNNESSCWQYFTHLLHLALKNGVGRLHGIAFGDAGTKNQDLAFQIWRCQVSM